MFPLSSNKIVLVDIYNLIFREFHVGTISVYACLKKIKQLNIQFKTDKIFLIADSGKKTWRHEIYPHYKEHRVSTDPELKEQLKLAPGFARSLKLPWIAIPGWEADDIIASIVHQQEQPTIIVAADKDILQLLVYPYVSIWDNIKKQFLDSDYVLKKYHILPAYFGDYLALVGDPIDNIPGAPGIGPKTAIKLLKEHDSLDKILQSGKIKEIERVQISKKLVSLATDISLDQIFSTFLQEKQMRTQVNKESLFDCDWVTYFNGYIANEQYFAECNIEDIPQNLRVIMSNIRLAVEYNLNYESIHLASKLAYGDTQDFRDIFELTDVWQDLESKLPSAYYLFEKKIEQCLLQIEDRGLFINLEYLDKIYKEKLNNLKNLEQSIYEFTKKQFLISSPKQVAEILNNLGISSSKKTDEDTLQQIEHPLINLILEYRKIHKTITTYLEPLKKYTDVNGIIHTTFDNNFANTGRIISRNPNMQNLPKNSEMRKLIIPRTGYCFVGADYNQIELRILAELANISFLKKAFKENIDMHSFTAEKLFGVSNSENRFIAKTVNFGIIYGISSFGLSNTLKISQEYAKKIIEDYYLIFPEIKEYQENTLKYAKLHGYVCTYWGRRCYVSTGPESKRQAINAPIQGTAAEIIKYAMINLDYIILQVHDEILAEVPEKYAHQYAQEIESKMINIGPFYLPVTVKMGYNWGEMHEF